MLNLSIDPAWTLQMHATDEIFIEQVARMLSHPNRPDALTCFNDTVAASVYEAARRAGLRVGADLGVIGKDKTFTVGLQAFIQENTTNWVNMAAATVLGLIPVLILFLSFQKTFIAGMTSGAVKA
ncbi:MAG: substrate-binding domain-containing protein [Eubacteriales bacterium]|nr:substrate-binding domain-containing protein [Eubacteriales bacterium]